MPMTLPGAGAGPYNQLPQPALPRLPASAMIPRQPQVPTGAPVRIPAALLRAALAQRQRQRPQLNPALYQAALRQALGRMISPQLLRSLGAM